MWQLGCLLFEICNQRHPFIFVRRSDYDDDDELARECLEVYRSEIKQLQDLEAPSVLPLAKDIYMQMLVLDPT